MSVKFITHFKECYNIEEKYLWKIWLFWGLYVLCHSFKRKNWGVGKKLLSLGAWLDLQY